jgi:hypothetical protein
LNALRQTVLSQSRASCAEEPDAEPDVHGFFCGDLDRSRWRQRKIPTPGKTSVPPVSRQPPATSSVVSSDSLGDRARRSKNGSLAITNRPHLI